jgi:hypothetical protein
MHHQCVQTHCLVCPCVRTWSSRQYAPAYLYLSYISASAQLYALLPLRVLAIYVAIELCAQTSQRVPVPKRLRGRPYRVPSCVTMPLDPCVGLTEHPAAPRSLYVPASVLQRAELRHDPCMSLHRPYRVSSCVPMPVSQFQPCCAPTGRIEQSSEPLWIQLYTSYYVHPFP